MPTEILAELDSNLTLDQLQATLRAAEKKLADDDGRVSPAEVISFSQGTVEGRETNVATFNARETAPLPVTLLGDVPADPFEREMFFQSLGKRGFELICFSDVLVGGKTAELVTCRPLAASAGNAEPTVPADTGGVPGSTPESPTKPPQPSPPEPTPPPPVSTGLVSQPAFDLMVEFEGLDQPGRWPGEFSGISLGVGYDLAHVTAAQFERDWGAHLTPTQIARLKTAIGKRARAAAAIASRFIDIKVSRAAAMDVFTRSTLPRFTQIAARAFPGMENLPSNAQGALVSLVFNRGADMKGDRRREMAAIRRIIENSQLPAQLTTVLEQIAAQIRSMKRLWDARKMRGLHRRRDAEAKLVLSAAEQAGSLVGAVSTAAAASAAASAATGVASAINVIVPAVKPTGEQLVDLARKHCNVGERYRLGAFVPKNKADTTGPWDCAEFVSWCVYQVAGVLFGCENNRSDPAKADAYTGYWERDARKLGRRISVQEAAGIPGAVVLRYPPSTGVGHIAFSDGKGNTLEAKGAAFGVVTDVIRGRRWDTGVLIDGVTYAAANAAATFAPPAKVYFVGAAGMDTNTIAAMQEKLRAAGFDPGPAIGVFSDQTAEAVLAFQTRNNLMADGEVGPETAKALGVTL